MQLRKVILRGNGAQTRWGIRIRRGSVNVFIVKKWIKALKQSSVLHWLSPLIFHFLYISNPALSLSFLSHSPALPLSLSHSSVQWQGLIFPLLVIISVFWLGLLSILLWPDRPPICLRSYCSYLGAELISWPRCVHACVCACLRSCVCACVCVEIVWNPFRDWSYTRIRVFKNV